MKPLAPGETYTCTPARPVCRAEERTLHVARHAYAQWDAICAEYPDAELTDSVCRLIGARIPLFEDDCRSADTYGPKRIRRILERFDRYSPWVDEVALKRALNFDWDAIQALTWYERYEMVERLIDSGWRFSPDVSGDPEREKNRMRYLSGPVFLRSRISQLFHQRLRKREEAQCAA